MDLGRIGIVVAARTDSSRLPGKALLPLAGRPMILYLLGRLRPVAQALIVFATTDRASDDHLAQTVADAGFPVFRGSTNDLVARHVAAAAQYGLDTVGRVTGDCPFVNAELIDYCLDQARSFDRFDIASTKGSFPVGLDLELYRADMLARINDQDDLTDAHREHLTLYIYDHKDRFDVRLLEPRPEWRDAAHSYTVDTPSDHAAAAALAAACPPDVPISQIVSRRSA